jgi:hypothetical protein
LIFEPIQENPIIEVQINGNVEFTEETDEQNFRRYLRANVEAIHQSVRDGFFEIIKETTIPGENNYLCNEYNSLNEWKEDRLSFCEDLESFTAMSARIRRIVEGRAHRVIEYWREYQVILRKK